MGQVGAMFGWPEDWEEEFAELVTESAQRSAPIVSAMPTVHADPVGGVVGAWKLERANPSTLAGGGEAPIEITSRFEVTGSIQTDRDALRTLFRDAGSAIGRAEDVVVVAGANGGTDRPPGLPPNVALASVPGADLHTLAVGVVRAVKAPSNSAQAVQAAVDALDMAGRSSPYMAIINSAQYTLDKAKGGVRTAYERAAALLDGGPFLRSPQIYNPYMAAAGPMARAAEAAEAAEAGGADADAVVEAGVEAMRAAAAGAEAAAAVAAAVEAGLGAGVPGARSPFAIVLTLAGGRPEVVRTLTPHITMSGYAASGNPVVGVKSALLLRVPDRSGVQLVF